MTPELAWLGSLLTFVLVFAGVSWAGFRLLRGWERL